MFESLAFGTGKIEFREILDALAFYQRVTFTGPAARIVDLVGHFGVDNAFSAVDSGLLGLVAERGLYVVQSDGKPIRIHRPSLATFIREADGRKVRSVYDEIERPFFDRFGKNAQTRAQLRTLREKLIVRDGELLIPRLTERDFEDISYVREAIPAMLRALVPGFELPERIDTLIFRSGLGFVIDIPVDFKKLNDQYHLSTPISHSTLTPEYLLAHMLSVRAAIVHATEGNSDVWLDESHAACFRVRLAHSVARLQRGRRDIALFKDVVFQSVSPGDAVVAQKRTVAELLTLLENPETVRFKRWLGAQLPDSNLIEEYYRATFGEPNWKGSMPARFGKISAFVGADVLADLALGPILGKVASGTLATIDEFLGEKLLSGWRPNQWIEGVVRPFTS